MIRKSIKIDAVKGDRCGECASACRQGAFGMENGKAVLLRDEYCNGLGECLPVCSAGAISFKEREAAAYDEAAVLEQGNEIAQTDDFQRPPQGNATLGPDGSGGDVAAAQDRVDFSTVRDAMPVFSAR